MKTLLVSTPLFRINHAWRLYLSALPCFSSPCALGSGDSLLVESRTCDRKVASSSPCRNSSKIFFSRVNFLCWLLLGVRSTPVLLQWHVKDPGHSAESTGGRLHLTMHTSLTQWSERRLTMLSRHGVGTYPGMSSYATCQGILSHSCLSSLSHCGLILA